MVQSRPFRKSGYASGPAMETFRSGQTFLNTLLRPQITAMPTNMIAAPANVPDIAKKNPAMAKKITQIQARPNRIVPMNSLRNPKNHSFSIGCNSSTIIGVRGFGVKLPVLRNKR